VESRLLYFFNPPMIAFLSLVLVTASLTDADRAEKAELIRQSSAADLIARGFEALDQMPNYRMNVVKRERVRGVVGAAQEMEVYIRDNPLAVRAKWLSGPGSGRKLLYDAALKAGQMRVREAGLLGIVGAVWVGVDSNLAKRDSNHQITEMRLRSLMDLLRLDFKRAESKGGFGREDLGWNKNGHWCIRFTAPKQAETYAQVALICLEGEKLLPAEVEIQDKVGFLESFYYRNVKPVSDSKEIFGYAAAGL
jgi:hypothetical protein